MTTESKYLDYAIAAVRRWDESYGVRGGPGSVTAENVETFLRDYATGTTGVSRSASLILDTLRALRTPPQPDPVALARRDQFAMAALTGLLAADAQGSTDAIARWSYDYADAMEAARGWRTVAP